MTIEEVKQEYGFTINDYVIDTTPSQTGTANAAGCIHSFIKYGDQIQALKIAYETFQGITQGIIPITCFKYLKKMQPNSGIRTKITVINAERYYNITPKTVIANNIIVLGTSNFCQNVQIESKDENVINLILHMN